MDGDFDRLIERSGTASLKWDGRMDVFGRGDVIPLWVADMDFAAPPCVREALARRLAHGVFGYTRVPPEVAGSIVSWLDRRHGWAVKPEWVVPCPSVVYGLSVAVRALTGAKAEVVTQPPVYHPFTRVIEASGRVVAPNRLRLAADRYTMDLPDLHARLASGARLLLLCSPHNPGGRVWSRDELAEILAAAEAHDAAIVCDEIHSDLAYGATPHVPIGSLEGAADRVVTMCGPTKAFNFPGLPVGYAVIPNDGLRARFQKEMRSLSAPGPSIMALDALQVAYRDGHDWLMDLRAYLEANRAAVERFFAERLPAVRVMRPEASYLAWIDFRPLGLSEDALSGRLVREAGVGLTRGSAFGAEGTGFMRLNFACPRALLDEALERIGRTLA